MVCRWKYTRLGTCARASQRRHRAARYSWRGSNASLESRRRIIWQFSMNTQLLRDSRRRVQRKFQDLDRLFFSFSFFSFFSFWACFPWTDLSVARSWRGGPSARRNSFPRYAFPLISRVDRLPSCMPSIRVMHVCMRVRFTNIFGTFRDVCLVGVVSLAVPCSRFIASTRYPLRPLSFISFRKRVWLSFI